LRLFDLPLVSFFARPATKLLAHRKVNERSAVADNKSRIPIGDDD
jgi:hypothetical protein